MHDWMLAGCWLDASCILAGCWLDAGWMLARCWPDAGWMVSGLNAQEARTQQADARAVGRRARSWEGRQQQRGARSAWKRACSWEARIEPEYERGAHLIQQPSLSAREEARTQQGDARAVGRCVRSWEAHAQQRRTRSREARTQLGGANQARMREGGTFYVIIEPECDREAHSAR
jgi:hypothetical protein